MRPDHGRHDKGAVMTDARDQLFERPTRAELCRYLARPRARISRTRFS
jgi:hypothetical protein